MASSFFLSWAVGTAPTTWSTPAPRAGVKLDLGPCVAALRDHLPEDSIICNGAGNYSGWWHRYWRDERDSQLAPTGGAMGYGVAAATEDHDHHAEPAETIADCREPN